MSPELGEGFDSKYSFFKKTSYYIVIGVVPYSCITWQDLEVGLITTVLLKS